LSVEPAHTGFGEAEAVTDDGAADVTTTEDVVACVLPQTFVAVSV
jgi:hypothetical protein